jgi:hypothetical protein
LSGWQQVGFARPVRRSSKHHSRRTKARRSRRIKAHRPTPGAGRWCAGNAQRVQCGCAQVLRPVAAAQLQAGLSERGTAMKGHAIAAGKTAASGGSFHRRRNEPDRENGEERCNSNGLARLLRTALLLQAAQVLTSGKPTMDSRRILELAIDLENGKRPCAEYGGGGNERCKYYSHGTLANEMARPCCTHTHSLSIFV